MEHIGKILRDAFRGKDFEDQHVAASLKDAWEEIAGADLAARVYPARYKRGYLLLVAESSPWLHRAALAAETLRVRSNEFLGGERIRTVRVRLKPAKKDE